MNYHLVKDLIDLSYEFEKSNSEKDVYPETIEGFKKWISDTSKTNSERKEPHWEGKNSGRSPESVIATAIVHMNRFGKNYFKSAISGSDFSTQEDAIYLIVLKFNPNISKMDLIKKNVHEKPVGMQIINRLIAKRWIDQTDSEIDKRSKILNVNEKGLQALDSVMPKIRQATDVVSGDLTHPEKIELIRLLDKLHTFHQPIYNKNIPNENLLDKMVKEQ
ncbi:MAG TPA: helix-turn-helix domain-containing protein [Flavobacteriaceae bacterium]|nr:helix-turn-helix domain-containing protein [Flavobacteriaceae bacterium]